MKVKDVEWKIQHVVSRSIRHCVEQNHPVHVSCMHTFLKTYICTCVQCIYMCLFVHNIVHVRVYRTTIPASMNNRVHSCPCDIVRAVSSVCKDTLSMWSVLICALPGLGCDTLCHCGSPHGICWHCFYQQKTNTWNILSSSACSSEKACLLCMPCLSDDLRLTLEYMNVLAYSCC